MSDFLAAMAEASRLRAAEIRDRQGEGLLSSKAVSASPVVPLALSGDGFDLIAETKLASPSEGRLAPRGDDSETVLALSTELAECGAAALSVLTEPSRFDGDIAHLELVTGHLDVPVMRKDFLVDPIQVLEARAAGASGVLLIARMLEPPSLLEMTELALSLGMFALIELFEEQDLDVASVVLDHDVLIGVNARDLSTLAVDLGRHEQMADVLGGRHRLVAESGILEPADAERVAGLGYRLALVGTGLGSSREPRRLGTEMIEAGRVAAGSKGAV